MNIRRRTESGRPTGFTLVEAILTLAVMTLLVVLCLSAVSFSRVTSFKSKEEAVAMGFLDHYAEMVRALPFANVMPGWPVNPLLDGTGGGPNIRIPAHADWVPVNTEDFLSFHPDLIWLKNRMPEMRVTLTTILQAGEPHTKHLRLELRWNPPFGRGYLRTQRLDVVRVRSL